jgi:ankyrin repeat protein
MENSTPTPATLQGRPRILELAAAIGVPLKISKPPIGSPSPCPTHITDADNERANALLSERRTVDPEYKAPKGVSKLFKKKTEIETFGYKEVNRAFAVVISEGGPLGLVEALRKLGGDVNVERKASTKTWNKITRNNQQDRRSDILPKAVQDGELEMVRLLASYADEQSLDDALPYAIERGHLDITKVLLEYGADPTEFHEQFLAKVGESQEDMVELLMQGPKRPCMECRATGLVKAIEMGSLRNATALLLNEADADYQTAAALQLAVKSGRNDLTVAIIAGQKPPSPISLDLAISNAYAEPGHDLEKKIALIEICLCGGAKGDHTAETLLNAAVERQSALIDLLLLYGASVDYKGGAVIQHAILEGQRELLVDLLQKKPSALSLSNAIEAVMTISDISNKYEVTELLLTAGASGIAIAQALITAIKLSPEPQAYKLIQLLLERGNADVNFEGGKSIHLIAAAGRVDVLQLLLASEPAVESVNAAFPFAMEIQDISNKQVVVEKLLQAGAVGLVVDEALVTAAKLGADGIALARLLLGKASVDFDNGKALCEAIRIRCFELVQALVSVKPSLETLFAAWAETVGAEDDEFQFKTFEILLEFGMKGDAVSQSLVVAATKGTPALELSRLLLKHGASVDYGNGEALVTAVQRGHIDTLELLLSANPSKPCLTPALATAQALKEDARLAAVAPILRTGVVQEVGDAGLLQAVQEQPRDSRLVQLFLDSKASPDFSDGSSVLHAAKVLDLGLLKMLAPAINSKDVVSNAFGVVFQSGDKTWRTAKGLDFVELLIQKGASGEHINNAAVQAAVMFDIDALELVADPVSSEAIFTTAFTEATGTRDDWVSAEGLTTIQFLLERGASGPELYAALRGAARAFNFEALQLLSTSIVSPEAYTVAFDEAMNYGDEWLWPENLDVIELLLQHGAGGETLHRALVEALDAYAGGNAPEALVDLLLHYKADVNFDGGEAVQLAASSGNEALMKKLLGYGPTQESLSLAFSIAIASQHDEQRLIALINVLMQNSVKPDVNFVYPSMDSPLILCLQLYPESPTLVQLMCDIGCNLETEIQCEVYDDEIKEPETVTPLAWALFQPDNMISIDVITALLNSKGKFQFIA